ncbi:MAG TPA: alpha/beta hydrolase, partial [Gemmatimonadaceae bacterium]|nr:alpha/beta hydrolase [Gemmatimonadaceae bacterium]
PPEVLLLESPFTSARDMARIIIAAPLERMWRFVSRVHYDTIERVRELGTPVWVVHGSDDLIIPSRMGRDVFAAARNPGELLVVDGAGHNDVTESGREEYWQWVTSALAK